MSPTSLPGRVVIVLACVGTLVIFALSLIVVRSRNASRQAATNMDVVFRTQAPALTQANKLERQRDAVLNKDLARISHQTRSAKNPKEIIERLPEAFSTLPQPVSISLGPPVPGSDSLEAPAIIAVPQADLQPLFDHLEECRACEERLATAQQDLNDERAKVTALTLERDAAAKAARGGGFWSRLRSGAKWFAIGAAAGALAASAAHR